MKTSKGKSLVETAYTSADDDTLLGMLRSVNVWDSFGLLPNGQVGFAIQNSMRLFGNANVGNLNLCNLQVPGQIAAGGNHDVVITNWYARTTIPDASAQLQRALELFAHHTYATVQVGSRVRWSRSLFDLLRSWRGDQDHQRGILPLWPMHIPARENVSVQIDAFSAGRLRSPADLRRHRPRGDGS
jgi:hypothetical protein